jgi:Cft2 family RNA processing exonuclease
VSRGYTSHTKIYELEKLIPRRKPLVFITFSDYDPSGKTMASTLPKILEECIPFFQTHTVVGALTEQQIKQYNLLMITKEYKVKGSKIKIRKQICELDALDPNDLRQIIRESIEHWIDNEPKFNQRLKDLDNEKQKLKTAYINTLKNLNIP